MKLNWPKFSMDGWNRFDTCLSVYWQDGMVRFLRSRMSAPEADERHLCIDNGDPDAFKKIGFFLRSVKPSRTVLVIPRSEVLQKEISLSGIASPSDLETRLSQALPYALSEMAYSVLTEPGSEKGILCAVPGPRIREILGSLRSMGIDATEVLSEDQALFGCFRERTAEGPVLALVADKETVLAAMFGGNGVLYSQVYSLRELSQGILVEVSDSLRQIGLKPVKAMVMGNLETHKVSEVFGCSAEAVYPDTQTENFAAVLFLRGALLLTHSRMNLLPHDEKVRLRSTRKTRLMRDGFMSFVLFLACVAFLGCMHLYFLDMKCVVVEKKAAAISAEVSETRRIMKALSILQKAQNSKRAYLGFLADLSGAASPGMRLKELRLDGKGVLFQGESPSHAFLSQMVQGMEKMPGSKEVKLEHARLRKRLEHEFIDFEVTARWQA